LILSAEDKLFSIVLATQNQHKIDEIRAILGGDINYQTIGEYLDIALQETGRSLKENSFTKAAFSYKVSGKASLADDSGLFVEALNGEPGIYSARYGADDQERIAKLLKNLEITSNRTAKFKAVFVYYYAPGLYEVFDGECIGQIAKEPRGTGGFGYDPIFIPKGYNKTFAELGPSVKNHISHRARALEKLKTYLQEHT
jgi:non-canonical purine NTP pyrophosphatase (RdgB/HAM1 family)